MSPTQANQLMGMNRLNIGNNANLPGNSKTPKEATKRLNGILPISPHERTVQADDRKMNLSMDVAGRTAMGNNQGINIYNQSQIRTQGINLKKTHGRDFSLRNKAGEDKLINHSVHEFGLSQQKKNIGGALDISLNDLSVHHGNHLHSKSLMKSPADDNHLLDKKSMERKRYDQNMKNYNSKIPQGPSQGEENKEGDAPVPLDSNVNLKLENLIKIDDKFCQLIDCVKQQRANNISQLCSDWWELTDEEEYCVSQFSKAAKEDKVRLDVKVQMTLEILSIAVVNYYTSSPDILKPSQVQV